MFGDVCSEYMLIPTVAWPLQGFIGLKALKRAVEEHGAGSCAYIPTMKPETLNPEP